MPRSLILLIILIVAIAGLLWFFSNRAEEVPTQPIEVNVSTAGDQG